MNEIKLLAKKIVEYSPDTIILFGIKTKGNAQLFFQCTEKIAIDMDQLMETACSLINGRGGGCRSKPKVAVRQWKNLKMPCKVLRICF